MYNYILMNRLLYEINDVVQLMIRNKEYTYFNDRFTLI